GLCPFHAEKTPSFVVFPESGTWHCFGACGTGGDIFNFIMRKENLSFGEALRLLAERAGVALEPPSPERQAEETQRQRILTLLSAATLYFHHLLLNAPAGQGARAYLESRGLNRETWGRFQLGFAPDEWRALSDYLLGKGYAVADLAAAGLIVEREDRASYYDRFRNRLVIPIRDPRGQVVAFGARALDNSLPKYLNSPQTPLFDKGRLLFGFDAAAEAIRATGRAVIVEGYMDVLMAHQRGIHNVVATMGTALTEDHLSRLVRLARRLVLALDSDAAGDQATLRGLNLARETMQRRAIPNLTPTGRVRFENRLDVDLRILALPLGRDPDEVIRADPETWERLVEQSLPVVDYYFQVVLGALDLTQAADKSLAARELLPVIHDLSDPVQREHYVQKLARVLQLSEQAIVAELRRVRRPSAASAAAAAAAPRPPGPRRAGLEEQFLSYLAAAPKLLARVQRYLAEEVQGDSIGDEAFLRAENRLVFQALRRAAAEAPLPDGGWEEELEPAVRGHVAELRTLLERGPALPEDLMEQDAVDCALRLRKRNLKAFIQDLRYLLEEPGTLPAEQRQEIGQQIDRHGRLLRRIDQTLKARSLTGRRQAIEANGQPI
ncbi:MAG: DNA primase, partial [Chloroflexi bacterium]|nr:DNA primase [Chloroflexota bacterium]